MQLDFEAKSHTYSLAGAPLPSVSKIKAPLTDFSMVSPEIMAAAQAWGHAVHRMVELYLAETLDFSALDENLFGPLEAFERWLAEVKPFQAGPAIIDVKSRKFDRVADPVQLAAYHQLYLEAGLTEVAIERPMASVTHRFAGTPDIIIPGDGPIINHRILYLGRDGKYQYTPCYDRNAWPVFGRLLADHHRQQATNEIIHAWRNR